ncbi:MAG: diguanylate cyclase domain-containing protein, partial [Mycobacteriales bacterium]
MASPPLVLDDILADSTPPRRKPQEAAQGPINLDEVLGDFGDVQGGSSTAPAPRRGIVNAIGESLGTLRDPFNMGAATTAVGNRLFPSLRGETRTMVPPVERRTPDQIATDERAAAAKQYGRTPAEETATPTESYVQGPGGFIDTAAGVGDLATQQKLQARSTLQGRFSPEKWRQVAVAGMQYANTLHAAGRHDEAEDVLRKAYNAQLLSEGSKEADTPGAIMLSNLLGIVKDPYAGQRRNIAEATQPGMVASPEEQQAMGVIQPTAPDRPFSVAKDIAAPLAGMAPAVLAGGLAGRTLAAAGAGLAERAGARTIGSALGRLATETQIPEMLGPKIPVTSAARLSARIAEEANEFKAALPSMLKRGATEGQLVMGTEQYRMARQQGASVEQAIGSALQGAALNVPLGALAETGLGIAGRAAGVGFDPIGHIAQRIYDRVRSSQPLGLDVAPEGEVPPAIDQTPEAAHRQIGDALSQILNQKQTAETAENARVQGRQQDVETAFGGEQPPPADRAWWEANAPEETPPSAIEPAQALRFRGQEAENPPLRTAAQIAMERGSPTDEANAVVKMQRQAEFTQAARAEAAAAAQEPDLRLEQAAQARPQEVQGPRTLGETLDEAAQQREQGEPLASDYHDAINNYVDALAQIRDLPEDQAPTMRQQVSLARAKAALNAARSKYGRMLGASAVAALAANDDELTDKEKKFGGLAAVGMLGVPEGEHAPVEPEPGRFVSRLRTAVEGLQGKRWDAPVPAADWIGKLKGLGTFSKGELKLIQPDLEAAQAGKTKLDRADVLRLIEQKSPQIERVTLKAPERAPGEPLAHFGMGDPEHITDIDEVDTTNPDELQEQIANRGARVRAIESDIERQQEGARADMEERQTSMDNEVEHARGIIENDLNLPPDYLDPAIGYLDEHIEGDYIPRGAVDEAFEQIIDNLSEGRSEGRDIDEVRQELEDKGYTIEEEPITERRIGFVIPEEHYGLVRRHNGQPGDRPHEFTFGMGRPEDHPDQEHIDRARELFGDEAAQTARIHKKDTGETRVVVKDAHGKLVDWGMSEDGAITNAAQKVGIETGGNEDEWDDHVGSIKHDLQDYANARASWGEAESMHSSMTEDEESHFRDEHQEMDRLREEAGTLNDHLQAAEEAAQIPAPAQAPALAQPADPHLMPVEPPVKGSPHFSTYQRIGGGTNYRELLNSWSNRPEGNIPESAYGGHDYWDRASTQNVIGHVRAEDHIVHDIPGTEGTDIKVLDSDDAPVRRIKSQLAETRGKRDKALQQLQDLAQEFDRLPQEQRTLESTEGSRIAAEYGRINNDSVNISKRESALSDELREASGIPASAGQRVAVMIENQASLAQHQSHLGPAPTPEAVGQAHETRERAFQRLSNAREAYARVNDERETAQWAYAKADEAMPEELRRQFHQTFSDAYSTPPHYHIDSTIDNPESGWARQFQWLEAHGSPAMGESIRQLKEIEPRSIETARATDEADRVYRAADRDYDKLIGAEDERIDTPFNDTQASIQLNAARFLIDSAERGYDRIAWSDAANRVRNAHQQLPAARYVYDQATPGAMKRLLNGLGFKDVPVEKMYIKGEGHWTITLRPEMRQAIRRVGLPILGAIALVGAPSEAKAEDTASGESSSRSLYSGMVGGLIAGGALAALLSSKKLRRLVKENRELNRALMIDDLSGLANKKAFSIARHPIDADPHTAWVALGASQFKKVNDVAGHDAGDQTIAHFGHAITAAAKEVGIPMRGFRAGGDEFAFAVPKGREAEFIDAVERASQKHVGGVETQLHGASGETYAQADALLNARKEDLRTLNPSLRRETVKPPTSGDEAAAIAQAIAAADLPKTEGNQPHLDLHANPIGPALRQLVRYPAAASMVGLGALMGQSDNPNIQRAGIPTMILGAMSAIGSHRLSMAADVFGKGVISLIGQTDAGRRAIEFVQPDILLSPAAKRALEDYRQTKAYGRSVALEHARTAQRTGP